MDAATALLVNAVFNMVAPFLLERGKFSKAFPFMQPYAPVLNNVTSFVVALLASGGITYTWDPTAGRLILDGLLADRVAKAAIGAVIGFLIQKALYKGAIDPRPR